MDGIRQYLLSVTTMAILCAITTGLVSSKGALSQLTKFISGLIMTIVLIMPLINIDLGRSFRIFDDLHTDADAYIAEGEYLAFSQKSEIIKEQVEAYILDKAASLRVHISVEVALDNSDLPAPAAVTLTGNVSPYAKQQLTQIISNDLGIPEDHQTWI